MPSKPSLLCPSERQRSRPPDFLPPPTEIHSFIVAKLWVEAVNLLPRSIGMSKSNMPSLDSEQQTNHLVLQSFVRQESKVRSNHSETYWQSWRWQIVWRCWWEIATTSHQKNCSTSLGSLVLSGMLDHPRRHRPATDDLQSNPPRYREQHKGNGIRCLWGCDGCEDGLRQVEWIQLPESISRRYVSIPPSSTVSLTRAVLYHQPDKMVKSKEDLEARKENLEQLKKQHGIE